MNLLALVGLLAATLFPASQDGVRLEFDQSTRAIDPGKSVYVTLTLTTPSGVTAEAPDLQTRARGFSLADIDSSEEKRETAPDGSVKRVVVWKFKPEPGAETYKIAPFAFGDKWYGPIRFDPPAAREPVQGDFVVRLKKALPSIPVLVGWCALALLAAALLAVGVWWLVRLLARKVREHRMSPIERAWVELDRLLKKGLPGRGRYKDFYVELTMVVRRYVQRKYGIKAPHLTTEEFLREVGGERSRVSGVASRVSCPVSNTESLRRFLESSDLVKFAGVEATPDMADAATESARGYLKSDDVEEKARSRDARRETREPGRETGDGEKSK